MKMNLSVRAKLLTMLMATSGAAVLLASGASFVYDFRSSLRVMSQDLGSLADVAGANSVAAMAFGDVTASNETLAALALKPGVNAAALYDRGGKLFTSFQRDGKSGEQIPVRVPLQEGTWDRTTVVRPIKSAGELAGFIYISSDHSEIFRREIQSAWLLLAVMLGTMFVLYLMSLTLEKIISAPILALANTAHEVAETKNYSLRAKDAERGDEIGALVHNFNGMVAQMQDHESRLVIHGEELERRGCQPHNGARHREAARRSGQQSEERIPGEHESRDSDADERRHRNDSLALQTDVTPLTARIPRDRRELGGFAADRSSTTFWTSRRWKRESFHSIPSSSTFPRRSTTSCSSSASRGTEEDRARAERRRRCPNPLIGDPGRVAPDPRQSRRQRGQVHRARWSRLAGRAG